jgi:hypothetical protein
LKLLRTFIFSVNDQLIDNENGRSKLKVMKKLLLH